MRENRNIENRDNKERLRERERTNRDKEKEQRQIKKRKRCQVYKMKSTSSTPVPYLQMDGMDVKYSRDLPGDSNDATRPGLHQAR